MQAEDMATVTTVGSMDRTRPASYAGARERPGRYAARSMALRLFLTCWLIYGLHFATNTVREIYPALSLGDHLSFNVSEYLGFHPDIFEVPGRGAYVNNNPGASILGAIPYTLLRPVIDRVVEQVRQARAANPGNEPEYNSSYPMAREFYRLARERGLDIKFGLAAAVMQMLLMAPLSALSAVVLFYILLSLTGSTRKSVALALLYAFATPVFYRTAQLNHNLLVSHFALFAFALLWRPWDEPAHPRRPQYLWAGLLCGWAVLLDYSGVVVLMALAIYAVVRYRSLPTEVRSRRDLVLFVAGAIIPLVILAGYQWSSFGSPFFPAQHYMPPATFTGFGYQGMDWPHLDLLLETAFGMRYGLFMSTPLLLLALYAPAWFSRGKRLLADRETWFVLLFSLAFFLFCAANQYGRMQFNTGVRMVVPVTPFLFLLAAGVLQRMPYKLALVTGVVATYWSWCLAMYRDVEQGWGVFESLIHITTEGPRLPWLRTVELMGFIPRGPYTILLLAFAVGIIWVIWNIKVPDSLKYRKLTVKE